MSHWMLDGLLLSTCARSLVSTSLRQHWAGSCLDAALPEACEASAEGSAPDCSRLDSAHSEVFISCCAKQAPVAQSPEGQHPAFLAM